MRWREISYGLADAQQLITEAIAAGEIEPQPVGPLAYVLLGALRESALPIAAGKTARAHDDVGAVIDGVIA